MDDFGAILKIENDSGVPYNIRSIFTGLGDDPESYPVDTGIPEQIHCFLRFSSTVFAEYALSHIIDLKDVKVLPVQQDPHLVEQYRRARGFLFTAGPRDGSPNSNSFNGQQVNKREWSNSQEIPSTTDLTRNNEASGRRKLIRRDSHLAISSFSPNDDGFFCSARENILSGGTTMAGRLPVLHFTSAPCLVPTSEPHFSSDGIASSLKPGPTLKQNFTETSTPRRLSDRIHLSVSSAESAPAAATFPISCETKISMTLCGEVITYDLEGLDSDPRVIIELLKATKSERANYVVVGGFYRRSRNPQSAKAVLMSMIEEFSQRGVAIKELKPAFLMLSGCEVDLAKVAKADNKDSSVVSEHYAAAQAWLQKVFGKAEPLRTEKEKYKAPKHAIPTRPRALPKGGSTSLSDGEIHKMEREMQTLRARTTNQATALYDLRASKRKLQEDYCYERNQRRKYQQQLEDLVKERDAARKMERFALDQIKREVSTRRSAEERLETLLKEKEIARQ